MEKQQRGKMYIKSTIKFLIKSLLLNENKRLNKQKCIQN